LALTYSVIIEKSVFKSISLDFSIVFSNTQW
jgi:hypothetical protein